MDFAAELQAICDSEINIEIGWLWDGGIEVRLGDRMSGFLADETCRLLAEIVPWLQGAIAHFYPNSAYAQRLRPELRDEASRRLYLPPQRGAQVTCPNCGA